MHTLALILAIAGEDILLSPDQFHSAHGLLRCIRIIGHLLCKLLLLVCNLPDCVPVRVQLALLLFQLIQPVANANDLKQRIRLFPIVGLQEARQVQRQFFHEFIKQLLPALATLRVDHLEVAVLAFALHHEPV